MEEKRKDKICKFCKWYEPPTATLEGECGVDEDIESEEWCEAYEKEERR